jgi:hypothetical protein
MVATYFRDDLASPNSVVPVAFAGLFAALGFLLTTCNPRFPLGATPSAYFQYS